MADNSTAVEYVPETAVHTIVALSLQGAYGTGLSATIIILLNIAHIPGVNHTVTKTNNAEFLLQHGVATETKHL